MKVFNQKLESVMMCVFVPADVFNKLMLLTIINKVSLTACTTLE